MRYKGWIVAGLVLGNLAVYAQVARFDFVGIDDPGYVTGNSHVLEGPSIRNVVWAFGTTAQANWHPLTWLSLMLDARLGGGSAAVFHVTNLVLHVLATLALFAFFERATGAVGRSAFVAALFAVHPLHVESVAWISERKDVLSALFWWLALLAWLGWTRRGSKRAYVAALAALALGLSAKPMLVTLPLVLLLLDLWPLERLRLGFSRLVVEKLPFAVLAAVSAAVTLFAQSRGGAVGRLADFPLHVRIANAAVAAVAYLERMVWPAGLAVPYPYDPAALTPARVGACALVLVVVSLLTLAAGRGRPWLAVGWLWYLVTLLPVVGLLQVGTQPRADRYTYLTLVGPFVIVSWGAFDLFARSFALRERNRRLVLGAAAAVVLAALALAAHLQARHWRDTTSLFSRALDVTEDNAVAHNGLGLELYSRGRRAEALAHLREALRLSPRYAEAHANLGAALAQAGDRPEAIAHYREALRLGRRSAEIHHTLGQLLLAEGTLLLKRGDLAGAREALESALSLEPDSASAHVNLGVVLIRSGQPGPAVAHFAEALRLDPTDDGARLNLERARALGDSNRISR